MFFMERKNFDYLVAIYLLGSLRGKFILLHRSIITGNACLSLLYQDIQRVKQSNLNRSIYPTVPTAFSIYKRSLTLLSAIPS